MPSVRRQTPTDKANGQPPPTGGLLSRAAPVRDVKEDYIKMILYGSCLLYTSPSPRDLSTSRMPSYA